MESTTYLREPVVIGDGADFDAVRQRISVEDHTYVFVFDNGEFYAVKSFALLLSLEGKGSCDPQSLVSGPPLRLVPSPELTSRALDVLADEVTLVLDGEDLKYIVREDFS